MSNQRNAFTMIELIFIILILGILSAIAYPKLNATRDDARVSQVAMSISQAATEIASHAVADGVVPADLSTVSNSINTLKANGQAVIGNFTVDFKMGEDPNCLIFQVANGVEDANLTLIKPGSTDRLCQQLESMFDQSDYPIPLKGTNAAY